MQERENRQRMVDKLDAIIDLMHSEPTKEELRLRKIHAVSVGAATVVAEVRNSDGLTCASGVRANN